ncbi:MAG: 3-dehydroquinate synthase [Candidatus Aureabacteria bacterium]|nr:3-dehydroquinate synthase [Candidatus Auribacterota bacterium]
MAQDHLTKINVRIPGGRDYNIYVGYDVLSRTGEYIRASGLKGSIFLITSPTIGGYYLKPLMAGLNNGGFKDIHTHLVPDGERHKSNASLQKALSEIIRFSREGEKKVFIVNMGGGVIGDLGGFVASVYKRGISYVQVPTTLLAFVDCGIGGKTGINYKSIKNCVGAFHQPRLVYADLSLLKTLNKREMRSGLAEVIKYGVIKSPSLFDFIEDHLDRIFSLDKKVMERIAVESYRIKADYVQKDEFDTKGIRAELNYGHTIGHAIESASKYAYRHGEAVSIGMACVNDLAVHLGMLKKNTAARIENLLIRSGLPVKIKNRNLDEIMDFFWRDKKFINGKNRFIVATDIGKIKIVEDIPLSAITNVIKKRFLNDS